jgi:soluble lytic murein transglycosylase-like protein
MVFFRIHTLASIGILIALSAGAASADIYRFKDENGVWHFTNINNDRRYELYIRYHGNPTLYIDENHAAIDEASEKYGVESSLIKAVIRAESAFNAKATSSKGAKGLMQLMPYTADYLSVENAYEPKANILGGTKYLSMMLERFNNNIQFALAAYNAGPENVDKYDGVPPFEETKNFVKKVMTYYNQYKSGTK